MVPLGTLSNSFWFLFPQSHLMQLSCKGSFTKIRGASRQVNEGRGMLIWQYGDHPYDWHTKLGTRLLSGI